MKNAIAAHLKQMLTDGWSVAGFTFGYDTYCILIQKDSRLKVYEYQFYKGQDLQFIRESDVVS